MKYYLFNIRKEREWVLATKKGNGLISKEKDSSSSESETAFCCLYYFFFFFNMYYFSFSSHRGSAMPFGIFLAAASWTLERQRSAAVVPGLSFSRACGI